MRNKLSEVVVHGWDWGSALRSCVSIVIELMRVTAAILLACAILTTPPFGSCCICRPSSAPLSQSHDCCPPPSRNCPEPEFPCNCPLHASVLAQGALVDLQRPLSLSPPLPAVLDRAPELCCAVVAPPPSQLRGLASRLAPGPEPYLRNSAFLL